MIALRHVHIFLKAGLTIEHNDTASTLLFDLLGFVVSLATFDRWTGRYIGARYLARRCRLWLPAYLHGWQDDLRLIWRAWAGEPAWAMGAG